VAEELTVDKILFLAHSEPDGGLPKLALETLSGALELAKQLGGAPLAVGLVGGGGDVRPAARAIGACGAREFFAVSGPEFAESRYASDAAAAEALVRASAATLILAPGTARFSRALPGVAQRTEGRIDTHISALDVQGGTVRVERWFYRQRMLAQLTRTQRPWFLLFDSGVFEPASGVAGAAELRSVDVDLPQGALRTRVAGLEAPAVEARTIRPDANLLFVAGAGWTKKQSDGKAHVKEAEALIRDFLERSQASLGSSKSLVDQAGEGQEVISLMSHLNQVGQTGSTPRHPKGLATCCHGEEPHVVGWRFIKERRAVNLDPGCGWARGKADVLYVADAFKVMARVNELLGM
jgi:electron transfer flavoprotein alpha subunit